MSNAIDNNTGGDNILKSHAHRLEYGYSVSGRASCDLAKYHLSQFRLNRRKIHLLPELTELFSGINEKVTAREQIQRNLRPTATHGTCHSDMRTRADCLN